MKDRLYLTLGCGGYVQHDITLCSGTENIVADFNKHIEQDTYVKLMDFLDFACGLFDQVISDWNKIVNVLRVLREQYGLINDRQWEALYAWLPLHKRCGAYLVLVVNPDMPNNEPNTLIKSSI